MVGRYLVITLYTYYEATIPFLICRIGNSVLLFNSNSSGVQSSLLVHLLIGIRLPKPL